MKYLATMINVILSLKYLFNILHLRRQICKYFRLRLGVILISFGLISNPTFLFHTQEGT